METKIGLGILFQILFQVLFQLLFQNSLYSRNKMIVQICYLHYELLCIFVNLILSQRMTYFWVQVDKLLEKIENFLHCCEYILQLVSKYSRGFGVVRQVNYSLILNQQGFLRKLCPPAHSYIVDPTMIVCACKE